MRETGVIPPRARVELLAGILVDMHRPTARELEATRRIAGVLAEDVRFNVRDFDRMLEIGILADVQRHELLDGVVLDLDVDAQARAARVAADVAVCRRWANGDHATAARGEDVLLAVDVAAPPDYTQRLRWPVYARWGVMTAWIVDLERDEIRTLRRPPLVAGFVVERRRLAELFAGD